MDRHPSDPDAASPPRRLLETGRGSRPGSYGSTEWLLLASVALIWGSSYLFIDIGLEALQPGVIAVARVALGVAALALVPAARRPIGREDRPRVAFLAVLCYGLALNLAVPLQQRHGALPVLLRAQLAALVLLLPFGLWGLAGSRFAWGPVLAMVPLGVLGTGVAFVLMTILVGRVGGPRGAVATYFIPVVAIVLGVLLLGERVAPAAVAGTALVVAGAWLTSRPDS